uniref:Ig-like domain-containing protein n=1 Tax=Pelusios castaneus TaxID=367368 RepID=A0A8C8R9X3_9SAUR
GDSGRSSRFGIHCDRHPRAKNEMSQEAAPGSTVRLKSTLKGTPPLTIKWFKGDSELETGGACYIMTEALASYLELYAVKPSDSGVYMCKVTNVAGSVASVITVKGLCQISPAPIPFSHLLKHRITIEESLISMQVFRFDASDVGEYQCRVTNAVGSCVCSSEVTLKGWYPSGKDVPLATLDSSALQLKFTKPLFSR